MQPLHILYGEAPLRSHYLGDVDEGTLGAGVGHSLYGVTLVQTDLCRGS